jgi:hypothetical protein
VRNLLLAVKQSFVRRKSGEAMPPHRAKALRRLELARLRAGKNVP